MRPGAGGGGGGQPRARVVAASAGSWPRCCRPAAGQLGQKPSQSNLVPRAPGRGSCPRPSDPLAVPDLQAQAQGPSSQAPPPRGEPVSTAGCRPCPCPCPAQAERCCPHGWSRVQLCSGMEPGWGGGRGGGSSRMFPRARHTPARGGRWGTEKSRELPTQMPLIDLVSIRPGDSVAVGPLGATAPVTAQSRCSSKLLECTPSYKRSSS